MDTKNVADRVPCDSQFLWLRYTVK